MKLYFITQQLSPTITNGSTKRKFLREKHTTLLQEQDKSKTSKKPTSLVPLFDVDDTNISISQFTTQQNSITPINELPKIQKKTSPPKDVIEEFLKRPLETTKPTLRGDESLLRSYTYLTRKELNHNKQKKYIEQHLHKGTASISY